MAQMKQDTTTLLVLSALRERDDFMDLPALLAATGRSKNQLRAALFMLRRYRAVDVVIEPSGHSWWFALPPEGDTRIRVVAERTPESKPRNRKKGPRKPTDGAL